MKDNSAMTPQSNVTKVTFLFRLSTRQTLISLGLCGGILLPSWFSGWAGLSPAHAGDITPPPGQGTPKGTAGGGSRSSQMACHHRTDRSILLMALKSEQTLGLTLDDRPN